LNIGRAYDGESISVRRGVSFGNLYGIVPPGCSQQTRGLPFFWERELFLDDLVFNDERNSLHAAQARVKITSAFRIFPGEEQ
jgi:hypothetical protein